jgi:hypothetical protein
MSNLRRMFSSRAVLAAAALSLLIVSSPKIGTQSAHAAAEAASKRPPPPPTCSKDLKRRNAEDTIRQHLALLQAGNLDAAMCDYADDAVVILPNQIVTGLDNIRAGLAGVGALLGGTIPQVQTLTTANSVVMITFTAFGTPCTIPDGSDTYIVDKGHIVTQTVHDTFHNAPGATCPLAAPGS